MKDGKLILQIGADVTEFNQKLGDVQNKIKNLTKSLAKATGKDIGKINIQLTGLERTQDTLLRFGAFAEGTLGALKNQLATLKQERLEIKISDTAKLEEWGRKIEEATKRIKEAESAGRESKFGIIPPAAINSIEYFRDQIKILTEQRARISIDTQDGIQQISNINIKIDELKNNIKSVEGIGQNIEAIDPNSILGLQNKLSELEKKRIRINVTDEGQLAALNTEIAQVREQIDKANSVTLDPQGKIQNAAAKARQSIVNLGLVIQDLPFGFIAIQNNIPNLVQSFATLQTEAKSLGVTTGSLLAQQFAGTAGKILALGLAFSIISSAITALIQKYGSFENAVKAIFGVLSDNYKLIQKNTKAFNEYRDSIKSVSGQEREVAAEQSGNIARINALTKVATDASKSDEKRSRALKLLQKESKSYFGELTTGKQDIDKIKQATDLYTQSIIANARAQAYANKITDFEKLKADEEELLRKLKSEEKARAKVSAAANAQAEAQTKLSQTVGFGALTIQAAVSQTKLAKALDVTQDEIGQSQSRIAEYGTRIEEYEAKINAAIDSQLEFNQSVDDVDGKKVKVKFDFEIPKLEDFLKFENFFDPKNALNRLDEYGDVLLDIKAEEKDRINILKKLQQESLKVTKGQFDLFKNLDLGKTSYGELTAAVVKYGFALQNLILEQEKLINIQVAPPIFKSLSDTLNALTKETRIPTIFDQIFKEDEFKKITDNIKDFTQRTGLTFDKWRQDIINKLILAQGKKGLALSLEEIKQIVDANVLALNEKSSELRLFDFLSGPAKETEQKRAKEFFDGIFETAKDFEKNIQSGLEKPFREFFDTLIEEGKVSFDSFFELFKDMLKRLAAQAIASGIAKILSAALFPAGAAAGGTAAAGGFSKFIGTFFSTGGLFRGIGKKEFNNVNLSGVGQGGLQLAGQVVFTQRGSDLVGVLNRTNSTINRVG